VTPGRLGLLVGLAVVAVAITFFAITPSYVWLVVLQWALLVALVGWGVFALLEWRRRSD
jgi:hypothetical protein